MISEKDSNKMTIEALCNRYRSDPRYPRFIFWSFPIGSDHALDGVVASLATVARTAEPKTDSWTMLADRLDDARWIAHWCRAASPMISGVAWVDFVSRCALAADGALLPALRDRVRELDGTVLGERIWRAKADL